MAAVLKDPADPNDPTLIASLEWWPLGGESIPKLALHIHGDGSAKSRSNELVAAIEGLRDPVKPLTVSELDRRVTVVVEHLGLKGTATQTRCAADPLETAIDVSVWDKGPP